jgi:Ca2+-binding RTX toxin-like protein
VADDEFTVGPNLLTRDDEQVSVAGFESTRVTGNLGDDVIQTFAPHARVEGGGGQDVIVGGATADDVFMAVGDGFDVIDLGDGLDQVTVHGTAADDSFKLFGAPAPGTAQLDAGHGNGAGLSGVETLQMNLGAGDDVFDASSLPFGRIDSLNVSASLGDDIVTGGPGPDTLLGGAGNDRLDGRAGNDSLVGETGDDDLLGGAGNDSLDGGAGVDFFSCGGPGDTIRFRTAEDTVDSDCTS